MSSEVRHRRSPWVVLISIALIAGGCATLTPLPERDRRWESARWERMMLAAK